LPYGNGGEVVFMKTKNFITTIALVVSMMLVCDVSEVFANKRRRGNDSVQSNSRSLPITEHYQDGRIKRIIMPNDNKVSEYRLTVEKIWFTGEINEKYPDGYPKKISGYDEYDDERNFIVLEYTQNKNRLRASIYDGNEKTLKTTFKYEFYQNGNIRKVSEYNSDGKLIEVAEYDQNGNILRITEMNEDGTEITDVFHHNGMPKRMSSYNSNGKLVSVTEFDENGNILRDTEMNEDGTKTVEEYDQNGKTVKRSVYDNDGNVGIADEFHHNEMPKRMSVYNSNGKLVGVIEFDENGNILRDTEMNEDGTKTVEEFDKNGNLVKFSEYGNDGKLSKITEYDQNGKVRKFSVYNGDENVFVAYEFHDNGNSKIASLFNINGKLVIVPGNLRRSTEMHEDGTKTVEEFDKNGKTVKRSVYGGEFVFVAYEFHDNGNPKGASVYNSNGKLVRIEERDENGNLVKFSEYGNDGKLSKITEYDQNGKVRKISEYSKGVFVRNLLEGGVQCVFDGRLTYAILMRNTAIFEEQFGDVNDKIWRRSNCLPPDLRRRAEQGGYSFVAIRGTGSGYASFRRHNGEWFGRSSR